MGNTIEGYSGQDEAFEKLRVVNNKGGPITTKDTETGHMSNVSEDKYATGVELSRVKFAVSSMQGHRATMEDTHIMAPSLTIPTNNSSDVSLHDHALFCVFDGHGGNFTSDYASEHFLRILMARDEWKKYMALDRSLRKEVPGIQELKSALAGAFVDTDNELKKIYTKRIEMYGSSPSNLSRGRSRKQKKTEPAADARDNSESPRESSPDPLSPRLLVDRSGSTAVMILLTPSHIICCNAGDSRAILCREGTSLPLSFDHKPTHGRELNRVKDAGGFVKYKRVDGDLAVSRGLGDFRFKLNDSLPDKDQKVSPVPDILVYPRDDEKDQFIALACDGIWDVMENQECAETVQGFMTAGDQNLGALCENMLDTCLQRNSKDNMTMCVVTLPACTLK